MHHKKLNKLTPKYSQMIQDAVVLHQAGQLEAAETQYRKLLKRLPSNTVLLSNLGVIFIEKGQLDDAVRIIERSLQINPNQANALNNHGIALKGPKRYEDALVSYERAIILKPDYAEAYSNRGNALQELKRFDEALKSYESAITLRPDVAEAYTNRGIVLQELKLFDEALLSHDRAIALKPDYAEAHFNRGIALKELNRLDEALNSYGSAIALKPDYVNAYSNRGLTLQDLKRFDEALASYDCAITLMPNCAEVYSNRGNVLKELNQFDDALDSHDRAIALKPDYADAYFNRGLVLIDLNRLDEALASYECTMTLNPDMDYILGFTLHTKMQLCLWDNLPHALNKLIHKINHDEKVAYPFPMLVLIDDPDVHRKMAEIYVNDKYPVSHVLPKIEPYSQHEKIRVGYFSADFRDHPVSSLTAELYETHDRDHFEIYAFSYGTDTKDEMNLRIKAGVDYFHDVRTLSDNDIAMLARNVQIDIAVDLGGFTKNGRTGIFAMHAAPIQISYIGYLGTMGANYYDYLIADQTIIPEQSQKYYSEKIAYLPSYQVNDSKKLLPTTIFTREDMQLPETGFVFCCFNNSYKITAITFDSWVRILKQVDGSVLLVYADNESIELNLTKEIVLRGVDPSRLVFGKRLPMLEYLARYRVADLFLDTLPYNAGTTASDALRMGLPVLTCMGQSFASRMAASLLNAVNLPELITTTQEQYEALAIELATHPEKLKTIKAKLAANLVIAPLYDTPLFTKHLEAAYWIMNDQCQKGLEAEHIYVEH
jgi:predicted O-linked N-acetylglucosamine transferase (SPINDLY family)